MEEAYLTLINRTNAEFVDLLSNLILDNRDAITALSSSKDISSFIKTKLNLTSKSQTKATGLTAAAPVAPRRSKATSQNPPQLFSLDQYVAWYEGSNPQPICGYLSNRGSNADKVCAAILTEEELAKTDRSHHHKYRCKRCYTGAKPKAGTLEKKMGELVGPNVKNRSSPGHNIIKGGSEKVIKNSLDLDTDDEDSTEDNIDVFNIPGISGYFFSKERKFPGLVITENDDMELCCIGKIIGKNGKSMTLTKQTELPEDWLETLSLDFTEAEKKFFAKKEISFTKAKKKPLARVEDSDSDSN